VAPQSSADRSRPRLVFRHDGFALPRAESGNQERTHMSLWPCYCFFCMRHVKCLLWCTPVAWPRFAPQQLPRARFKACQSQRMCFRFYQHLSTGCEWDWGLVWGHVVSIDLVHWQHLPPAISPSPGKLDADGCFSGCCTIDADGVPTLLYTGVRLRSNQECGPLPPAESDLQLPFIESQLIARAVDTGMLFFSECMPFRPPLSRINLCTCQLAPVSTPASPKARHIVPGARVLPCVPRWWECRQPSLANQPHFMCACSSGPCIVHDNLNLCRSAEM
jgi:hypothetical protein